MAALERLCRLDTAEETRAECDHVQFVHQFMREGPAVACCAGASSADAAEEARAQSDYLQFAREFMREGPAVACSVCFRSLDCSMFDESVAPGQGSCAPLFVGTIARVHHCSCAPLFVHIVAFLVDRSLYALSYSTSRRDLKHYVTRLPGGI